MKAFLTLFPIFSIHLLSSCTLCTGKKITCPAFNEPAFASWFPYEQNQRIHFKNSITTDSFSYVVSMLSLSASYETSTGGIENVRHGCGSSAYMSSSNYNNSPYGTMGITYAISESPANKSLSLHFNNADWDAGEITNSGIETSVNSSGNGFTKISAAQNMIFDNGITYPQVMILTTDTINNKTDRAYKLFIAKNIGIIGCEMFPSGQKWVIQ